MLNTEFVEGVKALIGTPYSQCDCKDVIAKPLGIRFSGTNWLWRSVDNSTKYRYLKERYQYEPPIYELLPGDILFKIRPAIPSGYKDFPDAYHVSVYVGNGNIIHSSPKTGVRVDEYRPCEWEGYGRMKQVEYTDENRKYDPDLTDHEMIKAIYNKICMGGND